jgi:hypothetical protein
VRCARAAPSRRCCRARGAWLGATHQAGERQFADQQVGALLELANLFQRTCAWPVAERLSRLGGARGARSRRGCERDAGGAGVSASRVRCSWQAAFRASRRCQLRRVVRRAGARRAPGGGERGQEHAMAHPASCVASSWASAARSAGSQARS